MTTPILPITQIGPDPSRGFGSIPVEAVQSRDVHKEKGEKITPAPMIPPEIKMSEEAETRLAQYLEFELFSAEGERNPFINRLARYKEKYRTKFPEFPKDWPIANASQIVVPVIRTAVQTLGARIYQTVMAAEPPASMRTEDPDFQDFAYDYERFFGIYAEEKLDLAAVLDGWVTELIKLGTAVLEPTTKLDRRAQVEWDEATGEYRKKAKDQFSGPILHHVPLEDFWIRPAYQDPNTAPWCGKEVRLTWSQIKDMALSGDLNPDKIDRIWRFGNTASGDIPATVRKQEEIEKLRPNDRSLFSIFEMAVRWDVDGDGLDEELMVYYHRPSRTVLRRKYSGFARRPWRIARYILVEHWFYGEGLCEILEHLQEEISTIHNQRIDNATIANLRIILVAKLIKGLRPGDRLWSGKVVRVQDVKADVGTLQLGDVYPSTVLAENVAIGYANQLSGAGEVATGQAQPVTRTTATAQLALLEELNRRFDKVVKGLRRTLRDVYRDLTDLFVKMGTGGLAEEWLGQMRGQRLESYLSLPTDVLARKIKIQVTSTRSSVNREVEFQSSIAVWQLLLQMWEQIKGTAPQQLLPVLTHEFIKAIKPVFKKVMQYADAPDPEQAVSVLTVLERILPAPEDMGGMAGSQAHADSSALIEQLRARTNAELGGDSGTDGQTQGANGNGGLGGSQLPVRPTLFGGQ